MSKAKSVAAKASPLVELEAAERESAAAAQEWNGVLAQLAKSRRRRDAAAKRLLSAQEACLPL